MDLGNAGHLKLALLAQGMRISSAAKYGLGTNYQEKVYSYGITDWVDEKQLLPSDIILNEMVYVGFHYRPHSRWELDRKHDRDNRYGHPVLRLDGKVVADAEYITRPAYYGIKTSNGTPMQSVGVSCANHGISFFINEDCQYFEKGEECRFCSLVPTQRRYDDTLKFKKVSQVQECINTVLDLGCRLDFTQISGGSFYNHNREARLYIPYIKGISQNLEREDLKGKIPIHLTCMPPDDTEILREWLEVGLDTLSFDLECTHEVYFQKYCPGKANSKGYWGIRKALRRAVDIFGVGKVFTIVIAGLEPPEVFISGVEDLFQDGVTPTINIYHHDPFSAPQMDVGEPDPEVLIDMTYALAQLFKKYSGRPGALGCAHYDIGHEIRKGYFDE